MKYTNLILGVGVAIALVAVYLLISGRTGQPAGNDVVLDVGEDIVPPQEEDTADINTLPPLVLEEQNTTTTEAPSPVPSPVPPPPPARNPLAGTAWVWQKTEGPGGSIRTAPKDPNQFVLSFDAQGRVQSSTDCNSMSGTYHINGESLSMTQFASTLMACEQSLEAEYAAHLMQVGAFLISGDALRLTLRRDAGSMHFTRQ